MGIINTNNTADVSTFVRDYRKQVSEFFTQTLTSFVRLGNTFWNDPNFTPEQLTEELGTDAGDLFRISGTMQQCLTDVSDIPIRIVPAGWIITPHADGTITLTRPESSSSNSSESSASSLSSITSVSSTSSVSSDISEQAD
jgi:hypothetical protein